MANKIDELCIMAKSENPKQRRKAVKPLIKILNNIAGKQQFSLYSKKVMHSFELIGDTRAVLL